MKYKQERKHDYRLTTDMITINAMTVLQKFSVNV